MTDRNLIECHDCGVGPGELHVPGCDVEVCPRCGHQQIGCNCIYEVNNMDADTLEEDHPEIFSGGPTEAMYAKWDAEWESRRIPWSGEWPHKAECREYGFFCRWVEGEGWIDCDRDHPDAQENISRLYMSANWNPDRQRFELRKSDR